MNIPSLPRYTNDVSSEYLRSLDEPYLSDERLAGVCEEVKPHLLEQQAFVAAHPATGIYRFATEGSHSRNGGVILQGSSPLTITLENGETVRAAQKCDHVTYPDGSTAQIATGAGKGNTHLALVGSRLSNGDEIIDTPQGIAMFIEREGHPQAEDFLPRLEI